MGRIKAEPVPVDVLQEDIWSSGKSDLLGIAELSYVLHLSPHAVSQVLYHHKDLKHNGLPGALKGRVAWYVRTRNNQYWDLERKVDALHRLQRSSKIPSEGDELNAFKAGVDYNGILQGDNDYILKWRDLMFILDCDDQTIYSLFKLHQGMESGGKRKTTKKQLTDFILYAPRGKWNSEFRLECLKRLWREHPSINYLEELLVFDKSAVDGKPILEGGDDYLLGPAQLFYVLNREEYATIQFFRENQELFEKGSAKIRKSSVLGYLQDRFEEGDWFDYAVVGSFRRLKFDIKAVVEEISGTEIHSSYVLDFLYKCGLRLDALTPDDIYSNSEVITDDINSSSRIHKIKNESNRAFSLKLRLKDVKAYAEANDIPVLGIAQGRVYKSDIYKLKRAIILDVLPAYIQELTGSTVSQEYLSKIADEHGFDVSTGSLAQPEKVVQTVLEEVTTSLTPEEIRRYLSDVVGRHLTLEQVKSRIDDIRLPIVDIDRYSIRRRDLGILIKGLRSVPIAYIKNLTGLDVGGNYLNIFLDENNLMYHDITPEVLDSFRGHLLRDIRTSLPVPYVMRMLSREYGIELDPESFHQIAVVSKVSIPDIGGGRVRLKDYLKLADTLAIQTGRKDVDSEVYISREDALKILEPWGFEVIPAYVRQKNRDDIEYYLESDVMFCENEDEQFALYKLNPLLLELGFTCILAEERKWISTLVNELGVEVFDRNSNPWFRTDQIGQVLKYAAQEQNKKASLLAGSVPSHFYYPTAPEHLDRFTLSQFGVDIYAE